MQRNMGTYVCAQFARRGVEVMFSVQNTWKELRDAGVDTAIVAFGSIEQHGHHLPLGVDWIVADAVAQRLGRELNAYVLPAMPFGCSREHMAFPGTITLRPSTLALVLEDIIESLYHHGFRKIVLLSTHGGNWVLKPTMRELNFKHDDLTVVWADGPLPERGEAVPEETHAGRGEGSTMLALRPDLVRPEKAVDSPGIVGQEFNDYVGYEKTTKTGAWGMPSEASAEQGAEAIKARVRHQAEYVRWALRRVEELRRAPGALDDGKAGE